MAGLEQSEIDQIPEDVQNKIKTFITARCEEYDGLKQKYEKFRVNSEQQYFDFEKQLISCRGKLETEGSQRTKLQEKLTELELKHEETTKKLHTLQESRTSFTTSEFEYKGTIQILENEKRDLNLLSNKKTKDIDRLNEEVKELQKKVTTANNEKCEAQARLNEIQSDLVSKEFREKRLQKEKEQLEKQVEWFNQQLTEKTNQLSSVRKEKTNNLLEVQAKLDEKTQEVEHIQAVVDSLKTTTGEQTKRMESLIEKLKDERENQMQLEEQFRQELAVQKRLVDLYKASTEENDAKIAELTGAVEELRRLLSEASTSYTDLKNSKAEEINHLEVTLTEKNKSISKLEEELKNANDLMTALKKGAVTLSNQAVESLSPSAAATSKLLKSGMSLTQIYNEYVQATDALSEEREENRRLNSYLEQILQEIEEKAPLLKRQREDYETALTNLNQMTTQLDTTMLECEKLRADADDIRRRFGHVQRENDKYKQTSVDLGKQVQHLLKEIEELRGGRIVRDDVNLSSNNVSRSSDMISEKLVTFRTIEELQQQNQRLMKVARDLSEKREQEENEATEQKTRELREQLDTYVTELEHLREARTRQAEMVESIVRQRDMYKVLLLQDGSQSEIPPPIPMTSTPVHPSPQSKIAPHSPTNKKELEDARAALAELRSEFEAYRKDKAENDKVQSEMLEKMRQNVSELRVANTKLSTQLESATERYKIAQNNAAGFKKEADLLQDRNHQASATILKHETAITNLKEELMTAQENVARWQVQIENLRKEKDLISNSEMRHAMELESIRREQTSQQMLMASLQAIQNNQERSEFEMKTRHQNQIEAYERECANLRRKLEASLEEKTRQATQWEDIVRNVHLEIKQEKDKQAVLQTKADNAILELETVKQELSTCEAKLAAAEIKIEKLSARTDEDSSAASVIETEAIKDFKNQLAQNQLLIKNLRQQVEAAKNHANQYKAIAEDVENNLKDQAKSMKEIQDACEKKLLDANAAKDVLVNRLELLEKDHHAAVEENVRLSNEGQTLHGDLRKQLTALQTELEEAITQKNLAVANSEVAQQDCKKQAEIAAEAQDKYQRELMLHAADVEGASALKKQLDDIKEHLQQSEEETVIYEKQLQDAKTSWNEQERVYKQETELLEKRCEEVTKQNAVLHEQMAKLSSQVVSIQQSAREVSEANTSFSDETGKTSEQLLEVIRFLRREKVIAETQLEAMQTECKRVKQKLAHVQKQEAEATRLLAEERQRAQISAETAANQVELMRKVSNMNVLTDSNKLLREERDQLLGTRQQLEAKIRQLESDIDPLQSHLREAQIQKESLTVEKESLQEEVNRWKARTSSLIEQSHKTDPEEQKRLQLEKENMRKLITQAREESLKQKAEIIKLNSSITSLQNEISSLKQENTKMGQERENVRKLMMQLREENSKQKAEIAKINTSNSSLQTEVTNLKQESTKARTEVSNMKQENTKASQELTNLKKQLEEKTKECDEKGMTINKLKEIGRKYKQQATKVSKELEDVKVKAADQETDKANMATSQQTISELRNTVTSLESRLVESQNEAQAATKRAEQALAETNSMKENLNTSMQDLSQTQEKNTALKTEVDTFEERVAEFERKQSQLRSVLQTARTKMMAQKAQMERLETENKELKALLDSKDNPDYIKTLKAQYESRISDLEKQIEDLKKSAALETERLQSEISELQNKVQQLQKQLDNKQHKHSPPQQPVSARHTGSVTPSSTSSEAPKTANIKPMAPSTSTSRQAPAMTTPHSSTSVKATASIRPMAISPTTANLPQSGTPTATVMPTTVSQHEASTSEDIPGPSGLQQASLASTAAGSSRIQIVEPQVAGEWNQDVTSSEGQGSEETATNIADAIQVVNPTPAAQPSTSTSGEGQTHTLGVALGKRTREEESTFQEDSETKRSRLGNQEHAIPTITVIDENQQVITQIQPQLSSVSTTSHSVQAKTGIATPSTAASMKVAPSTSAVTSTSDPKDSQTSQEKQVEERSQTEADRGHRSDDVIMVLSDEEDHEAKDNNADEEDEEDYEEEDDDEDDDDDDDDEEIEEADDTDDVVIIDIDEHQQQQQHQSHAPGGSGMSASTARPQQAFQGHSERLSSVGRTQQLTPFMIGVPGNIFEEDDCTVPSTPTLSQPRRADGFAEALNSPAVAQRFVFGSVGEVSNNPDLAQLESQRALGMDDTRMDLSSFDESGGRSAPATPTTLTILAPPESVEVSVPEPQTLSPVESSTMDPSEMFSMQSTVPQEPEGVEEEDEALLEGDGDPDEEQEAEDKDQGEPNEESQAGADGSSKSDLTKESSEGKQDKTDKSSKPPIKKIIWDPSQASSSASASLAQGGQAPSTSVPQQQQQQSPPAQQRQRATQRRAQGLRRGAPSRGRNQYWGSGQTRGSQFPPRGSSGRGFSHGY